MLLNEAYKNIPNNDKLSQMILKINSKVKDKGLMVADPIYRLTKDVQFLPVWVFLNGTCRYFVGENVLQVSSSGIQIQGLSISSFLP